MLFAGSHRQIIYETAAILFKHHFRSFYSQNPENGTLQMLFAGSRRQIIYETAAILFKHHFRSFYSQNPENGTLRMFYLPAHAAK